MPGLVVLFSCESGASRTLRRRTHAGGPAGEVPAHGTQNLGYQLAACLGTTVVAMRYPVDDEFSVTLGQHLYDALLVGTLPIDEALRAAVPAAATDQAPISAATPMLLGDASFRLVPDRPVVPRATEADEAPQRFVGRTALTARLIRLNTPAVLLTGMPGIGKTACLAEASAWHRRRGRDVVWHQVVANETPASLLAALGEDIRDRDTLVVLDDVDAAPIEDVLSWLTGPGAR
ncbi:MAG: ATP-binding protein, partial [Actinobacteria bacterium]